MQALNGLAAGGGQVVLVLGAPGVGKTAIGVMARALAREADLDVVRARGAELEQRFAFGVVRQLFDRLAAGEDRDALFADAAAGARAVLDAQGEAAGAGETQFELLHALFWFLVNVADRGPLVAIVDDLHWADRGSVAFVGYVARRIEELPVLLVVTARESEEGDYRRLIAELAADPAVTVLRPGPLSEAAVTRLVRDRLGSETPDELCEACHRVTSGNPLFLTQLLYALHGEEIEAASAVEQVGGQAVKEMVGHRLGSLGESTVALAQAVAVLGGRAPLLIAADLAGLDEDTAARAADSLVRGGFFEPREELAFVHPIVRAAVYDQLAPAERQVRHGRAACALLDRAAPDEQIASHILAVPDGSGQHWLGVLLRAADEARRRASLDTAAVYLRRALTEPGADEGRVELLRMLGLCEAYSQDLEAGEAHVREAFELASGAAEIGRCSLSLGRLFNVTGETVAAVDAFAAGLERVGDAEPGLALTLEAELVGIARLSSSLSDTFTARSAAFRAKPLEGAFLAMATSYTAIEAALSDGALDEVAALAERALSGAALSPNRPAFYIAIHALVLCERFEAAHRYLTEALRLARGRGTRVTDPVVYCHRAFVSRTHGAMAAARSDVDLGLEASEPSNFARRSLYASLVHCLIEDGALDEADRVLSEARLDGLVADTAFGTDFLAARGRLRLAQGDARAALGDLAACGRRARAWGPRGLLLPHHWACDAALAYNAVGERDAALALVDETLAVAREFGAPGALGVALRTAGVIRADAALLEQAVAALDGSEAKLERARALFELGSAQRSRERLRDARALAVDCAAPALVAQVEARLAEGGGRLPRLHASGVEALTAQERRIAELAAAEMTNRQIAQELYLTEKTVETHLSNAYRKLTIKSRRQLATKLASA